MTAGAPHATPAPDQDGLSPVRPISPSDPRSPAPPAAVPTRTSFLTRWRSRAPREPRGWKARWLINVTWPWFVAILAGAGAVLAVVSIADLFLIKTAFDPLIGEREVFSWLVAIALALLAVVAALEAGRLMRKHHATGEITALGPVILLAGWGVVGAGLFVLRWQAVALAGPRITFEGGAPAAEDTAPHLWMALVLATLHLVTGATAFAQGYVLANAEAFALRTARAKHRTIPAQLAEAEAVATRLAHNLGTRLTVLAEADAAAETARQARRAVAAHVQAAVRVRIAQHLGQPSATGVIRARPDQPIRLSALD